MGESGPCPVCGFKLDRDANATITILSRGLTKLGPGQSEQPLVETALPLFMSSDAFDVVDRKRVVESGIPTPKEAEPAAE